jgi:head-tail adaptor
MQTVSTYRHIIRLQNPGMPIPDGQGGFTDTWIDLTPATLHVSIDPASAQDLERLRAGTVIATATHLIRGRHHPQITTLTRILFGARVFQVMGVFDPEARGMETILAVAEEVT